MPKLFPVAEEVDGIQMNECQSSQTGNGVLYLNTGLRQHVVMHNSLIRTPVVPDKCRNSPRENRTEKVYPYRYGVYIWYHHRVAHWIV